MTRINMLMMSIPAGVVAAVLAIAGPQFTSGRAHKAPKASESVTNDADRKYSVTVPGGLAFSEFRGYESWQAVSLSRNETAVAITLGNPVMMAAYRAGFPANGKTAPDGAKMAKIHWSPKANEFFPSATVPGDLQNVDFMVKDSKRFTDSGGWGYAVFEYDAASKSFAPGTAASKPPQGHDAKCGFACHTAVKKRDYVFTNYGAR